MNPTFEPLWAISPTLASALQQCWLRVAYSRDPALKRLRRPTDRTALGTAAHALTEKAWKGDLSGSGTADQDSLSAAWDQVVEQQQQRLAAAWAPAVPPTPPRWPGYALTRARLLRRLLPVVAQATPSTPPVNAAAAHGVQMPSLPWVERRLKDDSTGLIGTPDRVEQRGEQVVVVDFKSGVHQGEMTPGQGLQLLLYAHLVQVARGTLPQVAVVLDGDGKERTLQVAPSSVAEAVAEVTALRDRYNGALMGATSASMAAPGPDVCRGCPYRPVCRPFAEHWSEDWKVGRGVQGLLQKQGPHAGTWEIEVLAQAPVELKGSIVRVTGLVAAMPAVAGDEVAVVRTDVLGDPHVLRSRWSTLLWPVPPAPAAEVEDQAMIS